MCGNNTFRRGALFDGAFSFAVSPDYIPVARGVAVNLHAQSWMPADIPLSNNLSL